MTGEVKSFGIPGGDTQATATFKRSVLTETQTRGVPTAKENHGRNISHVVHVQAFMSRTYIMGDDRYLKEMSC